MVPISTAPNSRTSKASSTYRGVNLGRMGLGDSLSVGHRFHTSTVLLPFGFLLFAAVKRITSLLTTPHHTVMSPSLILVALVSSLAQHTTKVSPVGLDHLLSIFCVFGESLFLLRLLFL